MFLIPHISDIIWHLYFSDSTSVSISATAAAKSLQSCPTLCNPIDSSQPGSAVPGILQARTLEWVAILIHAFSSAWKWKVKVKSLSRVWLLATPWTAAYQAPPGTGLQPSLVGCHCLLQLVSLGPSNLKGIFSFFLWLTDIPLGYIPHVVYPFICQWTLILLPCLGYCDNNNNAAMNIGVRASFQNKSPFHIYAQEWDCWMIW